MNYWIMKSEPDAYSIDQLKIDIETNWEGVRNYQARNFMRDDMKKGDLVLFYHSSCKHIGIAGIAKVSKESHPDLSAQDPKSQYYDPKASQDNPRWFHVSLKFHKKLKTIISLDQIKAHSKLKNLKLIQKGNRLSIIPISESEYKEILSLS